MTSHLPHPDVHEHGLADDCPRCTEHAQSLNQLDARMLAVLRDRVARGLPARSENEAAAMDLMVRVSRR